MKMLKNDKGFTLLESLAAIVIMSMCMWGFSSMISYQVKVSKQITGNLNSATATANAAVAAANAKRFTVVYFPVGQCNAVDNMWGKQVNSQTVMVYTDATCTTQLGTLNQSNNSTYFNDVTSTLWVISSSVSGLRAVVINLNM